MMMMPQMMPPVANIMMMPQVVGGTPGLMPGAMYAAAAAGMGMQQPAVEPSPAAGPRNRAQAAQGTKFQAVPAKATPKAAPRTGSKQSRSDSNPTAAAAAQNDSKT